MLLNELSFSRRAASPAGCSSNRDIASTLAFPSVQGFKILATNNVNILKGFVHSSHESLTLIKSAFRITLFAEQVHVAVMHCNCSRKVLGSSFGLDIDYPKLSVIVDILSPSRKMPGY